MKNRYLAVYDYGTGGIWAVIAASSKNQIITKYPVLTIFDERPGWMSEADYEEISLKNTFDIDAEPPAWLSLAVREQRR